MENAAWTKTVGEMLYSLDAISKEVHSIDTDSRYKEAHKLLDDTFNGFDEGSFILKDALATKDVEKFKKGNQVMQNTAVKMNEVFPMINKIADSQKANNLSPKTEQVSTPKQEPVPVPP